MTVTAVSLSRHLSLDRHGPARSERRPPRCYTTHESMIPHAPQPMAPSVRSAVTPFPSFRLAVRDYESYWRNAKCIYLLPIYQAVTQYNARLLFIWNTRERTRFYRPTLQRQQPCHRGGAENAGLENDGLNDIKIKKNNKNVWSDVIKQNTPRT